MGIFLPLIKHGNPNRMKRSVNLFLVFLLAIACLGTGCGIKPGSVSAPQGEDKDNFPRVYPDPSTFQHPQSQ
jgi:hypothetical protein